MIILLSPAKTLDFNKTDLVTHSMPRLLAESDKLIHILKKKSAKKIKALMGVSDHIAALNVARYQQYARPFTLDNAKQAALAFRGDVYLGLQADTFDEQDFDFAQKHLRILSGLYGLLKPLDLVQPYRLEMGTKLKNGRKKNLYEFWNATITELLNEDLKNSGSNILINLASNEYFKSIKKPKLAGNLIHIQFKELRGDTYKTIAFNAKKARGAMAHQIVKYKLTDPEHLKSLKVNDHLFNEEMSDAGTFVFTKD